MLYGFPGETAADYEEIVELIRSAWHLHPPTGYGPIRLDRFSPYHMRPDEFGMQNVRPMAPFTYLYPFPRRTQMEIAYYFDFDYAEGRRDDEYAGEAIELTRAWMAQADRGNLELRTEPDGTIELLDTRRNLDGTPRRAVLRGWKAAVFEACDRAQPLRNLLEPAAAGGASAGELQAFLERCVAHRLMAHNGRSWLALAVHVPARGDAVEPAALEAAGAGVA